MPAECTKTMANLAQAYFSANNLGAARRAIGAAERLAVKYDFKRSLALVRILKGEMHAREGNPERAATCWRKAIDYSKRRKDPIIRFKAEFCLYEQAVSAGDHELAASLERLLHRGANRIPADVAELQMFKDLCARRRLDVARQVSDSQLPH